MPDWTSFDSRNGFPFGCPASWPTRPMSCCENGAILPLEGLEETLTTPVPAEEGGLWPLVQALPQTLRAPVVLFYYDGYSARETAQILGLREGAVRTRLCRGRQMLKEMLEKEETQ